MVALDWIGRRPHAPHGAKSKKKKSSKKDGDLYYYFDCFSILPIVPYDYLMKLGILFKLELFFLFFKSRMLFTKTYLVYLYSSVFFYQFYFYIKFSYVLIAFTILIIATLFQIQENFIITLLPTFGNFFLILIELVDLSNLRLPVVCYDKVKFN